MGDIDRGGVFAQLVGTMVLLEPEERALVKGHVINKFRGDPSLLTSGLGFLEERTGVPVAGVIPHFSDIHIPEEDSLGLAAESRDDDDAVVDVAVIRLPHIANFDDFDPLRHEQGVRVRYVGCAEEFGSPDLVIIPGSKTTMADLDWLGTQGLAERILVARGGGTPIIGICAGYQMLGERLLDPDLVESSREEAQGLGLLQTSTTFLREKSTHQVKGRVADDRGLLRGCRDAEVAAYEIHMGVTSGEGLNRPFVIETRSGGRVDMPDGALDGEGLTLGTYLHGLFHNRAVRRSILEHVAGRRGRDPAGRRGRYRAQRGVRQTGEVGTREPGHGSGLSRDGAVVESEHSKRPELTGSGTTLLIGRFQFQRQTGRHEIHIVRLRSHELVHSP